MFSYRNKAFYVKWQKPHSFRDQTLIMGWISCFVVFTYYIRSGILDNLFSLWINMRLVEKKTTCFWKVTPKNQELDIDQTFKMLSSTKLEGLVPVCEKMAVQCKTHHGETLNELYLTKFMKCVCFLAQISPPLKQFRLLCHPYTVII